MKVAIGCDHGGFVLKSSIVKLLKDIDVKVIDKGTMNKNSVDYPEFAEVVSVFDDEVRVVFITESNLEHMEKLFKGARSIVKQNKEKENVDN